MEETTHALWDLDSIGISSENPDEVSTHHRLLQNFAATFEVQNQCGIVSLKWKPDVCLISDNLQTATHGFATLSRKFKKNEEFRKQYFDKMSDYILHGHVEQVPVDEPVPNHIYNLPHQAVICLD